MEFLRFDSSHEQDVICFTPENQRQNEESAQRIRAAVAHAERVELIVRVGQIDETTAEIRFALGHLLHPESKPYELDAMRIPLHTDVPLQQVFTHVMAEIAKYESDFRERF